MVRTFPANGALFLGYEASRKLMMKQFDWQNVNVSNMKGPRTASEVLQPYNLKEAPVEALRLIMCGIELYGTLFLFNTPKKCHTPSLPPLR